MADVNILFKPAMVHALLRERDRPGTGKTQTRRLPTRLKKFGRIREFGRSDTAGYDWHFRDKDARWHDLKHAELLAALPWQIGDRLIVRERGAMAPSGNAFVFYAGNDAALEPGIAGVAWPSSPGGEPYKPCPAIHMPRWVCRLYLPVRDVRVQRLQEISEGEAKDEGALRMVMDDEGKFYDREDGTYRCGYAGLWDHINGAGSWDANPWVIALTFAVEAADDDVKGGR